GFSRCGLLLLVLTQILHLGSCFCPHCVPCCDIRASNSTARRCRRAIIPTRCPMNSYGGKELAAAFRTVRKNTIQVAEDLPESKYDFVAARDARSVAQMLTPIAIATRIWDDIHKTKYLN